MRSIVIDANLLVLLVVGLVDKQLISKHKRTRSFELADFELLVNFLTNFDEIVVTPNVMTEVSNLASQIAEPAHTEIRQQLAKMTGLQREEYCSSADAVKHSDFLRLGLTDCALLQVIQTHTPFVTVDLDLYLSAASVNNNVTNFNHLRESRLLNV
jgi:hypothetical protein